MKTIQQNVTCNFNAIDFKDAIIMVPLMNELAERYKRTHSRLHKEFTDGNKYFCCNNEITELINTWQQMKVLNKLGFTDSFPDGYCQESEFMEMTAEEFNEKRTLKSN